MLLKDDGGSGFQNPEPGSYGATCRQVIDLGTQEGEWMGTKNWKHQILVGWELNEAMDDGRPFVVSKFYTASLNEKSNLRHDLAAWRGRDFTDEELLGFDPQALLGKPCMLSLVKTDKGKIKVQGVAKLPKGMDLPPLQNPLVYFSLSHGAFEQSVFNGLSDGIKGIIQRSPEYRERMMETMPTPPLGAPSGGSINDIDDDIPF